MTFHRNTETETLVLESRRLLVLYDALFVGRLPLPIDVYRHLANDALHEADADEVGDADAEDEDVGQLVVDALRSDGYLALVEFVDELRGLTLQMLGHGKSRPGREGDSLPAAYKVLKVFQDASIVKLRQRFLTLSRAGLRLAVWG